NITVQQTPVATVTVSLGTTSIAGGATRQATATLTDAIGNVLTGRSIAWSSSNTAAATVSSSGLVTGVAAGSANIVATSEGKSGSAPITVTNPTPTASRLTIATQPSSSATSGSPFAQQPAIQLRDASNNVVQQSGVPVTATIASGGGTLNGTA